MDGSPGKALLYILTPTLLSANDDVVIHVELKSSTATLHFGAPSRLEDADWRIELVANFGEEEVRSICEKATQSSNGSKFLDFKDIFGDPGVKVLFIEMKFDGRNERNLASDLGSQSGDQKSSVDVYGSTVHGEDKEPLLQMSMRNLLFSSQENTQLMETESGQEESNIGAGAVEDRGTQDVSVSANKELMETAHVIVNMADVRPTLALSGEDYHEQGTPRRRQKVAVEPAELVGVAKECPRCNSGEVKFKYFNNKKVNQPRYQCLECKEFFTYGGKKLPTVSGPNYAGGSDLTLLSLEGLSELSPGPQLEGKRQGKERKRKAQEPPHLVGIEKLCRKCGSKNTAFKYLNNGQQDQPRYKCLDCKEMFQLHNKRTRPSTSADVNSTALMSDLSKETTSVESASAPHEAALMITGSPHLKQTERKRKAMEPEHLIGVVKPCPTCKSPITRFKYFNNKNVNQPRYECMNCHIYFTFKGESEQLKGDTLRSVGGTGNCTTSGDTKGEAESTGNVEGQVGGDKQDEERNGSLTGTSNPEITIDGDLSRPSREEVGEVDECTMDRGDFRGSLQEEGPGPGDCEGKGSIVIRGDTGEVIDTQKDLGQIGRGKEGQESATILEAINSKGLLESLGGLAADDKVDNITGF